MTGYRPAWDSAGAPIQISALGVLAEAGDFPEGAALRGVMSPLPPGSPRRLVLGRAAALDVRGLLDRLLLKDASPLPISLRHAPRGNRPRGRVTPGSLPRQPYYSTRSARAVFKGLRRAEKWQLGEAFLGAVRSENSRFCLEIGLICHYGGAAEGRKKLWRKMVDFRPKIGG